MVFSRVAARPSSTRKIPRGLAVGRLARQNAFSTEAATHPSNKTQVYISKSRDPWLNLSVEHYLLQHSPPESTTLLLYTNSPCVVFGRNQNPWLEANLPRLAEISRTPGAVGWNDGPVQLVRRRSGGGTVFHDEGNVNFSVICPSAVFDRNRYAEMVVRALKKLSRPNTRVNVRHDIVMDVHSEADTPGSASTTNTFKISGSAYKLTRLRSLHHGTCLLGSPNLSNISGMLRSPAEGFIKARGVDSVRSPVRNVDLENAAFVDAVVNEFGILNGSFDLKGEIDLQALDVTKVADGYKELQSRDWIYGQTPRFTFCTHPYADDPRPRPPLPFEVKLRFEARHGIIENFRLDDAHAEENLANESLFVGKQLHDVTNWIPLLNETKLSSQDAERAGKWINDVLGVNFTKIAPPSLS